MSNMTKVGIEIPVEMNDSLNKLVPWGLKSRLFRTMLARLEYELKVGGNDALAEWLNWSPPTCVPLRNDRGNDNHG